MGQQDTRGRKRKKLPSVLSNRVQTGVWTQYIHPNQRFISQHSFQVFKEDLL